MLSRRRTLLALASVGLLGCRRDARPPLAPTSRAAVLILANIRTNDPSNPLAEAMLVRDDHPVAVGSRAELDANAAGVRRIDWRDATIIPGLTDAHAHLLGLGQSREIVDLRDAASVAEIVDRLREHAPPQGWILGRGWDQNLWGGTMPTAAALDEAFGERPVWLRRIDGHAGWANSAVLRLAGIDAATVDPEGGEVLRDPVSNAATGVLIDNAMDLVPVPSPSPADVERWLRAATREAASLGLTGVHEMGLGSDAHAVFDRLARAGELPIRVHGYASEAWFTAGLDGQRRSVVMPEARYLLAGVKLYADGALGSRGAALTDPYADRPEHRGALMHPPEQFIELVRAIHAHGLQVATHAIGDLGIRTIIDAYAAAGVEHRPRIEHVQIVDLADIPRMAELGLIASMQPTHASFGPRHVAGRVGAQRIAGAYAWRRILDAKIPLAFGSDFPVEQPSPLLGLHAAVTRQDLAGQPAGGWLADQRLSMGEAIAAFTSGAAFAAGREDHLGRLSKSMRADFTCLDRDPFTVDPSELPRLRVRATMVDGELTFEGE
ncbi:MAG TPA: amidohydrolase [Enhygromyxa sp.]|nr:amidohydrolase [Enhygromyxa sp.]